MRKKRILLLLMAGVACLIGVIIGAEYNSPLIYIPFKICIGEGGVLRRVGKVVMARCSIFGVLGIEEGELSIGWDCGEWFWRDRRSNAACRVEGTAQRLDMTLYLNRDRSAKSLESSVFPPVVSPTCFNPDWNLARVVSRGAETVHVESKISINALTLRVR